jgi:hypothetical protein
VQFQAGTLWFNGTNLQIRNSANTAWVAVGGGGGGTVTGVAGTAPIVSSGGSAPTISILPATTGAAGSLSAADKVKIDALPLTIVSSVTGSAPIVVATGTTTPAISINAATTSLPGSVQLADAAASQGGTSATLVSTPAFSVPKDAAGMTGAAILPSGTDLQRAAIATPVAGMTRFNTDYTPESLEVYDGANWNQLAYVPDLGTLTDLIPTNGSTLPAAGTYENIIINAGVTVNVPSTCSLSARTSVQINGTVNANDVGNWGASPVGANANEAKARAIGQGLGSGGNSYGFATSYVGSGGYAGGVIAGAGSSVSSGAGGRSGGTVIFKSQGPITVGASAIIQAAGENGGSPVATGGNVGFAGNGGGSGGLIILQSDTSLTLAAGSQLFVNGGDGTNASVSGTVPSAGGGGGGGGGYIVLNSPATADSSTKTVTGGTGGLTAVTGAAVGGGIGAGFGGAGGAGSISGANGSAGSAGQVILNAYI